MRNLALREGKEALITAEMKNTIAGNKSGKKIPISAIWGALRTAFPESVVPWR